MKKALLMLSSLLVAVGAFAQGQVNFAAKIAGDYNAPVFLGSVPADTTTLTGRAEGSAYMVQLYAGPTASSLTAVGAPLPFRTGAAAGIWSATAVTIGDPAATPGGAKFFVQVRAWATAAGATYEQALGTGSGTGFGNITQVTPTLAPAVPANLTGLTSFAISGIVPEPSIMALGALGGLALLLRRRK